MDYINLSIILIWIICGVISYGLNFAYYQKEWPNIAEEDYRLHKIMCLLFAIFGPIILIDTLIRKKYKWGFMFK